jgi:hypothetical protein
MSDDQNFRFFHINDNEFGSFMKETHFQSNPLILYNWKKNRWMALSELTVASLNDVLNGSGKWQNL